MASYAVTRNQHFIAAEEFEFKKLVLRLIQIVHCALCADSSEQKNGNLLVCIPRTLRQEINSSLQLVLRNIETNYFELKKLQLNHCNLKDCPLCWNAVGVWVPVDRDQDNAELVKEIHELINSLDEKQSAFDRKVVSHKELNEFLQKKLKSSFDREEEQSTSKRAKFSEEED